MKVDNDLAALFVCTGAGCIIGTIFSALEFGSDAYVAGSIYLVFGNAVFAYNYMKKKSVVKPA